MDDSRRMRVPGVIAISGVAGSGKSTLGRSLASALGRPLVDLDSVTTPLLESLPSEAFSGHWLSGPYAEAVRTGRYAALRAVIHDVGSTSGGAVAVAPFTRELSGGDSWQALRDAAAPADVTMVRIIGDAALFATRRATRGTARDAYRIETGAPEARVSTIDVDAELTTDQQLARLLPALGVRSPLDPSSSLFDSVFDAVLCDLDGSLVDSTASVARSWRRWAAEFSVSPEAIHENHGRPARVLISRLLPQERHGDGYARIVAIEIADAPGLRPVRGADRFWASLPESMRAIVTSGTVPIATARLAAAGLATPAVQVTAEAVEHGKPDPEPYLRAAEQLGVDPRRCLVVEDAPAGIASARTAGCSVLAVTGTVRAEELVDADLVIDGLDRVAVTPDGHGVRIAPLAP